VTSGKGNANWTRRSAVIGLTSFLAGCSPSGFQLGSRTLTLPWGQEGVGAPILTPSSAAVERIGRGPVSVALLLPLTGPLGQTGTAMANAARLAIGFIEANPNIAENITLVLRDTGSDAPGATAATQAAVGEGARLILGPLSAEQVADAGTVARGAGIPLIGFANNGTVAGNGVYVLNVLPEAEMRRALGYLMAQGRRGPAGIFPTTPYGEALAGAFRTQAMAVGFSPSAVYSFSDPSEAQSIVSQARPLIEQGRIDALFIPDRGTAATFAGLLAQAGVTGDAVQLVGSADWNNDPALLGNASLRGAIFPAVDEAGLNAIRADYQARFGAAPPQISTIAYTAVILANVNTLSMANPPYSAALLTNPSGFQGRDGLFRFNANGRSDYALVMRQIGGGVLDGARLD
jgi:branched-chain amino acid transport system substrate-binding protein